MMHRTLGVTILAAMAVRVVNRLTHRGPPLPPNVGALKGKLVALSEVSLYAFLLIQPLLGWAMVSAGGGPVVLLGSIRLPRIAPFDAELFWVAAPSAFGRRVCADGCDRRAHLCDRAAHSDVARSDDRQDDIRCEQQDPRPVWPERWPAPPRVNQGRRLRRWRMAKRVVIWGTGFVGRMVIAEIVKHPLFELVGVGVSNPRKGRPRRRRDLRAGRADRPRRHRRRRRADRAKPDALVHYGPTAAHADDNIALITRFLRAGIDVCSTAMTPWVWPTMQLNPPNWIQPITEACELGESSCFTTGIDPASPTTCSR